jgi:hypothetical protein
MGFFFAAAALPLTDITAAAVINMVFAACLKKNAFCSHSHKCSHKKLQRAHQVLAADKSDKSKGFSSTLMCLLITCHFIDLRLSIASTQKESIRHWSQGQT